MCLQISLVTSLYCELCQKCWNEFILYIYLNLVLLFLFYRVSLIWWARVELVEWSLPVCFRSDVTVLVMCRDFFYAVKTKSYEIFKLLTDGFVWVESMNCQEAFVAYLVWHNPTMYWILIECSLKTWLVFRSDYCHDDELASKFVPSSTVYRQFQWQMCVIGSCEFQQQPLSNKWFSVL